jgi:hypothetical protein
MRRLLFTILATCILFGFGYSQSSITPAPGNYTVCPGEGIVYQPNIASNISGCGNTVTWTVTKGSFNSSTSVTTTTTTDASKSVTVYWDDVADVGKLTYSTTCSGPTSVNVTETYAIRSLKNRNLTNARIGQGQQYPLCTAGGLTLMVDVMYLQNTGGTTGITQQRADGYEWVLPGGWSSSGSNGTVTTAAELININPDNGCRGGTATVRAFVGCGSGRKYSNSASISLARVIPILTVSAPANYVGPSCGNTAPVVFTVTPISCATDYRWVFPSGWGQPAPVSSGTNNYISVQPSGTQSDAGSIIVTVTLDCGTQVVSSAKTLTFLSPTISVPALVCSSGTSVTLSNVSETTTVTWSVSANMAINSGQGTRSITVGPLDAASAGSGMISATTNCPNTTVPNQSTWIGTPVYQQFTFDGEMTPVICEGLYQAFTGGEHVLTAIPGGTTSSPSFLLQTSSPYVHGTKVGNNYNISVSTKNQNFEFLVRTSVSNGCGTKETCTYFTNWASISFADPYPNPSSTQTTLQLGKPGDMKTVAVYNAELEVVFNTQTTDKSVTIDTSNLPDGIYTVRVIANGKTNSRHLQVKH